MINGKPGVHKTLTLRPIGQSYPHEDSVQTDDQGKFMFSRIPAGKIKIWRGALVRGSQRPITSMEIKAGETVNTVLEAEAD